MTYRAVGTSSCLILRSSAGPERARVAGTRPVGFRTTEGRISEKSRRRQGEWGRDGAGTGGRLSASDDGGKQGSGTVKRRSEHGEFT